MINEKITSDEISSENKSDTVNVKSMLERFRRKAADILAEGIDEKSEASASEEKTENKIEPVSESTAAEDPEKDIVVEEISIDIEDMKKEISDAVRSAVEAEVSQFGSSAVGGTSAAELNQLADRISEMRSELEAVKKRLQAIQISTEDRLRDNGNNTTALHKAVADLRDRVGEITQTVNSVSKLSDSVFDLKNAQINMKKALDVQESALRRIKKKMSVSTAILSVIGVLIIMLQIIALLS
ncbi:MAG: hypothetical protein Q4G33_07260 [bacterium]|nr:hypothetical protein [bacterium]